MDVLCKCQHGQIRTCISCYTSRPVVTAASQVSPFRAYCNHDIQANIVYRVDTDQCDLLWNAARPFFSGQAMHLYSSWSRDVCPFLLKSSVQSLHRSLFPRALWFSPVSLSKAAPRFVSIDCILRIWHVSEITYRTKQPFENTYLNMLRLLLQYLKTICFIVLQSLKIGTF